MIIEGHKKHFNRRWDIASFDSYEKSFKKFKTKIINIFTAKISNEIINFSQFQEHNKYHAHTSGFVIRSKKYHGPDTFDDIITSESFFAYCQEYSIPIDSEYVLNFSIERLLSEEDEKEFYRNIEIILSFGIQEEYAFIKPILIDEIKKVIKTSGLNVAMRQSKKGVFLYPKGEKKLDDELVNKTLSFLDDKSNQHFEKALKQVKPDESLQKSIEWFLRYKLKNRKGFKKNIKILQELLQELENPDSPPEIRNIIFSTFNYLEKYFDEYIKHGDRDIKEHENEFLIYQTGLLLRYINSVELKKSA